MNEALDNDWAGSAHAKQLVAGAMDADTADANAGVADSLNGETKPDPAKLARTAIIKQDVMLSGTSTQSPASTVLTLPNVSMPTASLATGSLATSLGSASLTGALPESLFLSAVSAINHDSGSATPLSDVKQELAGMLTQDNIYLPALSAPQQLLGQPQVATPQIILTGGGALAGQGGSASVPVQQILIPVSTGNGTQQLISIPVSLAANSGGQIQLFTTANGQILATNLPSLAQPINIAATVNGAGSAQGSSGAAASLQIPASQAAALNGGSASQLSGLTQLITNSQGQIIAIGSPQVGVNGQSINASQPATNGSSAAAAAAVATVSSSSLNLNSALQAPTVAQPVPALSSQLITSVTPQVISAVSNAQTLASGLTASTTNINQLLPHTVSNSTESTTVDGINLDEIKEFAKQFKIRRLSLGLTQTQVGQALSATEGPSYSQSAICRFEKLDITPKSAQKIKPVLERWMLEAEERYKNGMQNLTDFIGSEPSKKRKRRTSFTPQALEVLNEHFERNTHPSGAEMTELAEKLNYDREVIRVWFCNKRQALKNTIKKLKAHDSVSIS